MMRPMDTTKYTSPQFAALMEAQQENEALQYQLVALKKIVKNAQKQLEELNRQNLENEKQIQELTHLNKANERVVKHLREKAEESAYEIKHLQLELENALKFSPEEEKRKAQLFQTQLKEKQSEITKFLEIAQAKEFELQKVKELLRQKEQLLLQTKGGAAPVTYFQTNDQELKAAQKHLAKKMKEVNDLTELNETYLQKIAQLEKELKERQKPAQVEITPQRVQGDLFSNSKPAARYKESLFE